MSRPRRHRPPRRSNRKLRGRRKSRHRRRTKAGPAEGANQGWHARRKPRAAEEQAQRRRGEAAAGGCGRGQEGAEKGGVRRRSQGARLRPRRDHHPALRLFHHPGTHGLRDQTAQSDESSSRPPRTGCRSRRKSSCRRSSRIMTSNCRHCERATAMSTTPRRENSWSQRTALRQSDDRTASAYCPPFFASRTAPAKTGALTAPQHDDRMGHQAGSRRFTAQTPTGTIVRVRWGRLAFRVRCFLPPCLPPYRFIQEINQAVIGWLAVN